MTKPAAKKTGKKKRKPGAGRKIFDGKDPKMVIAKLEQAWSVGAHDAEAALLADISPMSLSRYLHTHPAISLRKQALLNTPGLRAKVSLVKSLDSDPERALKYLERTQPKQYAPINKMSNTDPEGNAIAPVFNARESKL